MRPECLSGMGREYRTAQHAADFLRPCSDTLLQINFMWAKACKEVKVAGKTEFSLTDILKSGMMG